MMGDGWMTIEKSLSSAINWMGHCFWKEFGIPSKKIQLNISISNYNICSFKGTSIHFDLVCNPSKRSQLTGISNLCGNQPDFVFQQLMLGHWSLMILLACGLAFLSFLQKHPWFWQPEDCQLYLLSQHCRFQQNYFAFISFIHKNRRWKQCTSPPTTNGTSTKGTNILPPWWFCPTLKILKKLNSWKRGGRRRPNACDEQNPLRGQDDSATQKNVNFSTSGGEVVWKLYPGVSSDTIFIAWSFWRQRLGIPENLLKPFFEDSEI